MARDLCRSASRNHAWALAPTYEPTAGGFPSSHAPGQVEGLDAFLAQHTGGSARTSSGSTRNDDGSTFGQAFGCLGAHISHWNVNRSGDMTGIPLGVLTDIQQAGTCLEHVHCFIGLDRRQLESVENSHGQ
jgi:hypothetical protein